jgi:hypothetical protein
VTAAIAKEVKKVKTVLDNVGDAPEQSKVACICCVLFPYKIRAEFPEATSPARPLRVAENPFRENSVPAVAVPAVSVNKLA